MEKILIEWERRETWRAALTPAEALEQFGTADPEKIHDLMTGEHAHFDELEHEVATGDGSIRLEVTTGSAVQRDEGQFWLTESSSPGDHRGPYPDADEAFAYWTKHGSGG